MRLVGLGGAATALPLPALFTPKSMALPPLGALTIPPNVTATALTFGGVPIVLDPLCPSDMAYLVPADWKGKLIAHEIADVARLSARIENVTV